MAAVRPDLRPARPPLPQHRADAPPPPRVGGLDPLLHLPPRPAARRRHPRLRFFLRPRRSGPLRRRGGDASLERGLAAHRRYLARLFTLLSASTSSSQSSSSSSFGRPSGARASAAASTTWAGAPRTPSPPKRAPPPPPSRAPARGRTSPTSTGAKPIAQRLRGRSRVEGVVVWAAAREARRSWTFARCAARRNSHAPLTLLTVTRHLRTGSSRRRSCSLGVGGRGLRSRSAATPPRTPSRWPGVASIRGGTSRTASPTCLHLLLPARSSSSPRTAASHHRPLGLATSSTSPRALHQILRTTCGRSARAAERPRRPPPLARVWGLGGGAAGGACSCHSAGDGPLNA